MRHDYPQPPVPPRPTDLSPPPDLGVVPLSWHVEGVAEVNGDVGLWEIKNGGRSPAPILASCRPIGTSSALISISYEAGGRPFFRR